MDFIVTFGANGARIIKGVDAKHFEGVPGVAINPDLSEVAGIPPHHWQLVDSKIVPIPEDQRTDPNATTLTQHTVTLNPDFLKPHLTNSLQKTLLLAGSISLFVSTVISLIFRYL